MSVADGRMLGMPSVPHEAMTELLRNNPKLGLALIYYMFPIPRGVRARMGDSNLSTVVPLLKELRGDAVVVLETETGDWKRVVVIEPQMRPPRRWKRRSLAAYVAVAGAIYDCDSTLLMICYDASTAEECRKTIYTGHPRFEITPFVIFGHRTPDPFDPLLSFARAELVVLACFTKALNLEDPDVMHTVLECISSLDERRKSAYIYFVMVAAPEAARQALEAKMAIDPYDDPFIRSWVSRGESVGEARGVAQGAGRMLLHILGTRRLVTSEVMRRLADELILSCTDLQLLELWADRALTAVSVEEVFAGLPEQMRDRDTAAA
jgi:hypothetical protein